MPDVIILIALKFTIDDNKIFQLQNIISSNFKYEFLWTINYDYFKIMKNNS